MPLLSGCQSFLDGESRHGDDDQRKGSDGNSDDEPPPTAVLTSVDPATRSRRSGRTNPARLRARPPPTPGRSLRRGLLLADPGLLERRLCLRCRFFHGPEVRRVGRQEPRLGVAWPPPGAALCVAHTGQTPTRAKEELPVYGGVAFRYCGDKRERSLRCRVSRVGAPAREGRAEAGSSGGLTREAPRRRTS